MSPQWNKVVNLNISPTIVEATLQAGWPRRKSLAASSQAGNAFNPRWMQTLGTMGTRTTADRLALVNLALDRIAATEPLSGSRLHAVLDDTLMHVDVVKGEFAGMTDAALDRIAKACVADMMGGKAADLDVRWSLQPDQQHLAICAVAAEHSTLLVEAATSRRMRLASLRSNFAVCWDRYGRQQDFKTMVFVVALGGHAVVACIVDRSICALSAGHWHPLGPANRRQVSTPSSESAGGADAAHTIDGRVDQLLACLGLDAEAMGAFVTVLPAGMSVALQPRWARIDAPASLS